jgi:hypothetical protein
MSDQRDCQAEALVRATFAIRRIPALAYCCGEYFRRYGLRPTCKKVLNSLNKRISRFWGKGRARLALKPLSPIDEASNLRPGELVEVKSEAEIMATLDTEGKLRGLSFQPAMRSFCGQRHLVLKRVERIFLEESGKTRRVKNTVLLEGVICDGFPMGCDKSCFYYWREAWLRRVDDGKRPTSV